MYVFLTILQKIKQFQNPKSKINKLHHPLHFNYRKSTLPFQRSHQQKSIKYRTLFRKQSQQKEKESSNFKEADVMAKLFFRSSTETFKISIKLCMTSRVLIIEKQVS
jgi:hypothetical protein